MRQSMHVADRGLSGASMISPREFPLSHNRLRGSPSILSTLARHTEGRCCIRDSDEVFQIVLHTIQALPLLALDLHTGAV
jgi:hypothetical protein